MPWGFSNPKEVTRPQFEDEPAKVSKWPKWANKAIVFAFFVLILILGN